MEYLNIIIAAVFVNNIILTQLLGINPTISASSSMDSSFTVGMSITAITTLTSIITKLIYDLILVYADLEIFTLLIFVMSITIVLEIFNTILKRSSNNLFGSLEKFKPIIIANSWILGVSFIVLERSYNLLQTITYSIGVGIGFTLVSLLIESINYKYRHSNMPRQFREKATTFLALGLMALAFYGFKGIV